MPPAPEPSRPNAPESSWICPSCGSTATTRYCGNCGERSIAGVGSFGGDETGADPKRVFLARLRASLRALVSPPGQLTADWIRGRRVGYLAPLPLFLWINVAFFVIQSVSGLGILTWPLRVHLSDDSISWFTTWLLARHRSETTVLTDAYANVFNALESVNAKSLVIVMVPAFAVVLGVLVLDRRHGFKDSLIFATHFFAFSLIWLCALFPTLAIVLSLITISGIPLPSTHSMDLAVTGLEGAVLAWYLYVALDTVFALSRPRRIITVLALVAALYVILKAYHVVVFAVTLYST
jgi:Protein of unknown function (DUF3667)